MLTTISIALLVIAVSLYASHFLYWRGGVNKHFPNLQGKVIVVTGGTDGIGMESVKEFARLGAKVIFTGRSNEKAQSLIKSLDKGHKVEFKRVNQADLKEVKDFAEFLNKNFPKIDVLLNNAGLSSFTYKKTPQDLEFTMGINHFAHFYLTSKVLPLLKKSEKSRIVNVASLAHGMVVPAPRTDFFLDKLTPEQYNFKIGNAIYARSKLANVFFTQKLEEWLKKNKITTIKTVSLHPGVVNSSFFTDLTQTYPIVKLIIKAISPILWCFSKTNQEGAQTNLSCSLMPWEELESGKYYSDCKVKGLHKNGKDEKERNFVWEESKLRMKKIMGEDLYQ